MAVRMPKLTIAEVDRKVFKARAGKAAAEDGLPAIVWKETWPAVRDHVLSIFQTSLDDRALPTQWRSAKIIPLKKANKGDYSLAKAWRPVLLLSTLGMISETVAAERISFAAETNGSLPANHYGARKRKSAVQAHCYKNTSTRPGERDRCSV